MKFPLSFFCHGELVFIVLLASYTEIQQHFAYELHGNWDNEVTSYEIWSLGLMHLDNNS